jgi:HD-like signal output (HDOD) protein
MPTAASETLAALDQLPPFPPIALRMLDALTREELETSELVGLSSADPVLASEILHAANSALFGLPRRVKTLQHAIVLVGRDYLRPLLFTAALRAYLKAPGRSRVYSEWWRHSLACALLADGLAAAGAKSRGEAYTAGLLHDIGRLGLMMAVGADRYQRVAARRSPAGALEREREEFGVDHCLAGKLLLDRWELPQELAEASARHHEAAPCGHETADQVRAACSLATTLGFWTHRPPEPPNFEQWRAALPRGWEWTRRLEADPLRKALEQRIGAYSRI